MLPIAAGGWFYGHQYNAGPACEHCGGMVRHERWCITCDAFVQYAYGVVLDPEKLTLCDRLILHALGVSWKNNACQATCQST